MTYTKPERGSSLEIGQPTFTELIWAKEATIVSSPIQNVNTSLRRIASGKQPRISEPAQNSSLIIPSNSAKYSINNEDNYKASIINLSAANTYVKFRENIRNFSVETCQFISSPSGSAIAINPSNCPQSDCHVDVIWSIDNSGSMINEIIAVKAAISSISNLISTTVSGGSYRYGLQTFGQMASGGNLKYLLPLSSQNCGNIMQFLLAANNMVTDGGYEPWGQALQSVSYGVPGQEDLWTFRSDANAKLLIIITDEIPFDGSMWLTCAEEMGRCGIQLLLIWTYITMDSEYGYRISPQDPGPATVDFFDNLIERTGGMWVHAPNGGDADGSTIYGLVASYLMGLCVSQQPPSCPAGLDKIQNGTFDNDIDHWDNITSIAGIAEGRTVLWRSTTQEMELTGTVKQTISGLNPGSLVVLEFDVTSEIPISKFTLSAECPKGFDLIDKDDFTGIGANWDIPPTNNLLVLGPSNANEETYRTYTGLTPGSIANFSINIDSFGEDLNLSTHENQDIKIQLLSGATILSETTYNINYFDQGTQFPIISPSRIKSQKQPDILPFIFNGTEIDENEYPAVGKIGSFDGVNTTYYGSATLISKRHILTAAHCAIDNDLQLSHNSIRFKCHDGTTLNGTREYNSKRIFIHPEYDPNKLSFGTSEEGDETNDIAIIELDEDVVGVDPIKFSSPNFENGGEDPIAGDTLTSVGYGYGGTGNINDPPYWIIDGDAEGGIIREEDQGSPDYGRPIYGIKRKGNVNIDIVTNKRIIWYFDSDNESSNSNGDSGGPQLFDINGEPYIVSVTSGVYGLKYGRRADGSIDPGYDPTQLPGLPITKTSATLFNTKVSAYDQWIRNIVTGPAVTAAAPESGEITAKIIIEPYANRTGELYVSECLLCEYNISTTEGKLIYSLRNNLSTILNQETATASNTQTKQRLTLTSNVDANGTIEIRFDAEQGEITTFLIDNIILCALEDQRCLPGQVNGILNPYFESGVEYWNDKNNDPLTPFDSTDYWDDLIKGIRISLATIPGGEVRTEIEGLSAGTHTLSFELTVFEPDFNDLELQYGILDKNGAVIQQHSITRLSWLTNGNPLPKTIDLNFTTTTDDDIIVFLRAIPPPDLSGFAIVRNVLLCAGAAGCQEGYTQISYDDFTTSKGTWSGGAWDNTRNLMVLNQEEEMTQTYFDLTAGSIIELTFNSLITSQYRIEFYSNGLTTQHTTNNSVGVKRYGSIAQSDNVTIKIKNIGSSTAELSNILVCTQEPPECDGSISDLQVVIEWSGIPRQPINIFNVIIRYTERDRNDPISTNITNHLPDSEGTYGTASCVRWKQQGPTSTSILKTGVDNPEIAQSGDTENITQKTNWIWAIPDTNSDPESLILNLPTAPVGLIDNIEILLLMNKISTSGDPVNPPPLSCTPDPAEDLDISIRYTSNTGLQKEFVATINVNDIVEQVVPPGSTPWDTISSTGNGLKGVLARWESCYFPLDTVDGKGLDQCYPPLYKDITGTGTFGLPALGFVSKAVYIDWCDADVVVSSITTSPAVNEIQTIGLSPSSGGTWTISFTYDDITDTTDPIQYDATAEIVQDKLEKLSNIGAGNIRVTMSGIPAQNAQYYVEFIGNLAAKDLPKLQVDLTKFSSASYSITTINNGTSNERQIINRRPNATNDLTITFDGESSAPISYNASLNDRQDAVETMLTIGPGNILVTGNVSDRYSNYVGPMYIDFIGDLSNTDVPVMTVSPSDGNPPEYSVSVAWDGGPNAGVDEEQQITLYADGGWFKLILYKDGNPYLSGPIPYDADAETLKSLIINNISWLSSSDLEVIKADTTWTIKFVGNYSKTDMEEVRIDARALTGGTASITELQKGGGQGTRQRIQIIRQFPHSVGGSFRLSATIDGSTEQTTPIPWNTTADGLRDQLLQLSFFKAGDIVSVDEGPTGSSSVLWSYVLEFSPRLGQVPDLVADYQETLLCEQIVLPQIQEGPYNLEFPECDELPDLSCQSGPLLCKPGTNEGVIPDHNQCEVEWQTATRIQYERDLFDPDKKTSKGNYYTIRDMALTRGLQINNYSPYERNLVTGKLKAALWSTNIGTKRSFVLIENTLNTERGVERVENYLKSSREILPSRFVWGR